MSLGQRMILLAVEVYHHPFHQHFLGLTHLQDTFWAFCFDPNQVPIIDLSKSHDFFSPTLSLVCCCSKCDIHSWLLRMLENVGFYDLIIFNLV